MSSIPESIASLKGIVGVFKHPGDKFMWTVAYDRNGEFVVHDYNAQTDGFGNGYYAKTVNLTMVEFGRRMSWPTTNIQCVPVEGGA